MVCKALRLGLHSARDKTPTESHVSLPGDPLKMSGSANPAVNALQFNVKQLPERLTMPEMRDARGRVSDTPTLHCHHTQLGLAGVSDSC